MGDFVEDAASLARELGRPQVVGHSMGGLITQCLAAQDLIRAAVLLAPAPPRGISVLSPRVVLKQVKYLPAILRSRLVRPAPNDLRELVLNCIPRAEQDAELARLHPDSGRAASEMSITGVRVDAARVRCPLLIIAGCEDRFVPPSIAEHVARRYGAPFRALPNHGHMLPVEPGWRAIAESAADWLGAHDA
jgi:pimeloyl-ACP methyl ester carboxylesterase